jgi:hypothetical protein
MASGRFPKVQNVDIEKSSGQNIQIQHNEENHGAQVVEFDEIDLPNKNYESRKVQ